MRPEVTVILRVNAKHQRENMESVYEGFRSLGISAVFQGANVSIKTKRVAIWVWRLIIAGNSGKLVYCIDNSEVYNG